MNALFSFRVLGELINAASEKGDELPQSMDGV